MNSDQLTQLNAVLDENLHEFRGMGGVIKDGAEAFHKGGGLKKAWQAMGPKHGPGQALKKRTKDKLKLKRQTQQMNDYQYSAEAQELIEFMGALGLAAVGGVAYAGSRMAQKKQEKEQEELAKKQQANNRSMSDLSSREETTDFRMIGPRGRLATRLHKTLDDAKDGLKKGGEYGINQVKKGGQYVSNKTPEGVKTGVKTVGGALGIAGAATAPGVVANEIQDAKHARRAKRKALEQKQFEDRQKVDYAFALMNGEATIDFED